jgi:hypothetical protein
VVVGQALPEIFKKVFAMYSSTEPETDRDCADTFSIRDLLLTLGIASLVVVATLLLVSFLPGPALPV